MHSFDMNIISSLLNNETLFYNELHICICLLVDLARSLFRHVLVVNPIRSKLKRSWRIHDQYQMNLCIIAVTILLECLQMSCNVTVASVVAAYFRFIISEFSSDGKQLLKWIFKLGSICIFIQLSVDVRKDITARLSYALMWFYFSVNIYWFMFTTFSKVSKLLILYKHVKAIYLLHCII